MIVYDLGTELKPHSSSWCSTADSERVFEGFDPDSPAALMALSSPITIWCKARVRICPSRNHKLLELLRLNVKCMFLPIPHFSFFFFFLLPYLQKGRESYHRNYLRGLA
ncbi:hypothetical protein NL108_008990 [Boleophthalmus pectinirostris]|nr:hypothetical protein NL108_008990 [Boleophthalmus pectinirostris]